MVVSDRGVVRLLAIVGAALALSGCGSPVAHSVVAGVTAGQVAQPR